MITYDEAGTITDVGCVFVSHAAEERPFGNRSLFEYDFPSSAELSIGGFQLTVESQKSGTIEVLRTEPGGVIVFQKGIWTVPTAP